MVAYPKFVAFVKQVFSLQLRKTRLENLQLLTYGLVRARVAASPASPASSLCPPTIAIGCVASGAS